MIEKIIIFLEFFFGIYLRDHLDSFSIIYIYIYIAISWILKYFHCNILIPVPGNIRLSIKHKKAKARGI
jgi:hypothetical protein